MKWNWQQPDWPAFSYEPDALAAAENRFLRQSGEFLGALRHVAEGDRDLLKVELLRDEALKTSEIEGEILNRASVQSSLLREFGLPAPATRVRAAERGIAEMMVDLYRTFAAPLTENTMFGWHRMLMGDDRKIEVIGGYRRHTDAMQVVSGPTHKQVIHFEAPPSRQVPREMRAFVNWYNRTAPGGDEPLPALTRSGIAHLYFVSIHPFEDGNGRIARALSEKTLAQSLEQPSLLALAYTIERKRRAYYDALERANKSNVLSDWLVYFADTVLEAQVTTLRHVEFYIAKSHFYDRLRDKLNERQVKVIARLFREGIDGFEGGLSAENYIRITRTSRATATRDLQDLVEKGALTRQGELRHTRYALNLPAHRDVTEV
jgi:Fic family protein